MRRLMGREPKLHEKDTVQWLGSDYGRLGGKRVDKTRQKKDKKKNDFFL